MEILTLVISTKKSLTHNRLLTRLLNPGYIVLEQSKIDNNGS